MSILETVIQVILYVTGGYLAFHTVYLMFFAVAGHFYSENVKANKPIYKTRPICVLIPAYKEDAVILETAQKALKHNYAGNFRVVVIADQLQTFTLQTLRSLGAEVIEVHFEKSTKGKALRYAMNLLPEHIYPIAVILDADNIMGDGFLNQVDITFDNGYRVVQGHRTAKNVDTSFALLDACNEEVNNHIFRKGHRAVGLSSALIGSGMAFEFTYLKKLLADIGETAGEDKELDIRVLRDKVTIHYLETGWVYDEKVSSAQVFTKQRTRWIATQIDFVGGHLSAGLYQLLFKGNVAFFDKIVQSLLLPRVLLMGILTGITFLSIFLPWGPSFLFWFSLLILTGSALLIALPKRFYNKKLWRALVNLPVALKAMSIALIRSRKAGNTFIHTPHTSTSNAKL